jgi:orotate phosphoribosyltransferase-like protein
MTMAAIAAVAPWSMIGANGAACTLAAMRMAKMQRVKPTVDTIVKAGNGKDQATLICAVVNHSALAAARAIAGLLSTKEQASTLYVSKQTARMLGRARSNVKVRGKSKREKRDLSSGCNQQSGLIAADYWLL